MKFRVILISVFSVIYAYLAWSLMAPLSPLLGGIGLAVLLILIGAIAWIPLVFWQRESDDEITSPRDQLIQWIAFLAMGFMSFVFVFTVLKDVGGILPALRFHTPEGTALVFVFSFSCVLAGMINARHRVAIRTTEIPIAGLPKEFDGFRIAQISDLHVGPTIRRKFVEQVVEMVNETKADIAVLTGDLMDGTVPDLALDVEPLMRIKTALGRYYITGNHEYYWSPGPWIKKFGEMDFTVLLNRHVILEKGGKKLLLAGIPDPAAAGVKMETPDAKRAMEGAPSDASPRILLCHQPKLAPLAEEAGFDLQISGHTHGGQFFPWTLFVRYLMQFPYGVHRYKRLLIYVSRGTGYWGPPVRLGSLPEVSLLVLRPESSTV
ncbi:MAG: metallophosphoesterase [Bdellovibrionota bacterium]